MPGAVGAERIPATSVPNALERLRSGDVDAAMVPIENMCYLILVVFASVERSTGASECLSTAYLV